MDTPQDHGEHCWDDDRLTCGYPEEHPEAVATPRGEWTIWTRPAKAPADGAVAVGATAREPVGEGVARRRRRNLSGE